jgi:hypothetical protein
MDSSAHFSLTPPASVGELDLPPLPPNAASLAPRITLAEPMREADPFGEAELPPPRSLRDPATPNTPAADLGATIVRAEGGGTSYGEVNLGGDSSDFSIEAPLGPPVSARGNVGTEFDAVPQEKGPRVSESKKLTDQRHSQRDEPRPKARAGMRVFIGVCVALASGGSLALLPDIGPFGAHWIVDRARSSEYAALVHATTRDARRRFGADTAPEAARAWTDADQARASVKRLKPLAAHAAFVGYLRELRFGSVPEVHARAGVLLDELTQESAIAHLDLAKSRGDEAPDSESPDSEAPESEVPESDLQSSSTPNSGARKKKKKKKKKKKRSGSRAPGATPSRRPRPSESVKARPEPSPERKSSEERSGAFWKVVLVAAIVGGIAFYITRQKGSSSGEEPKPPEPQAAAEQQNDTEPAPKVERPPSPEPANTADEAQEATESAPARAPKAKADVKPGSASAPEAKQPAAAEPAAKPKEPAEKPAEKKGEPAKETVKKPEPKPAGDAPPFDRAAALTALNAAVAQASGCRQPGDPSGTARVVITFAPSGRVTSANLSGPPFAGTRTGGCIASTMRRARVPAFSGSHVTVSKSVVIR